MRFWYRQQKYGQISAQVKVRAKIIKDRHSDTCSSSFWKLKVEYDPGFRYDTNGFWNLLIFLIHVMFFMLWTFSSIAINFIKNHLLIHSSTTNKWMCLSFIYFDSYSYIFNNIVKGLNPGESMFMVGWLSRFV